MENPKEQRLGLHMRLTKWVHRS